MRRGNVFGVIVLSIITCGIYYLIAWVQIFSNINYGVRENDTVITDLLLSFVTYGIWGIFCFWKCSKKLYMIGAEDNSLISVLLAVFGLPIISLCVMRSNINNLTDRTYGYDMSCDERNALGIGVILFLVLFVFGSFCPMERIFGIPCPDCSMFSATYGLWKGSLSAAWYFHPAVFLLLPCAAVCAVLFVRNREDILKRRAFRVMSVLLLWIMPAVYPWRILYVFPHAPVQVSEHAPFIGLLQLFF